MKAIMAVSLVLLSQMTSAAENGIYTEWLSTSSNMNWSSGMVTAEGFGVAPEGKREEVGRLLACRAAITDAQRNIIEATKGVRVTVNTSVSKYAADYDTVKTAVDGVVQGARILSREMGQDNTCKVTLGLFVAGKLSNSIYQNVVEGQNATALFFSTFFSSIFPAAHAQQSVTSPSITDFQKLDDRVSILESGAIQIDGPLQDARKQEQPTGLILDVRGFKFLPSMVPEIKHSEGVIIYPSAEDKEAIIKSGKLLSLFSRSLDFAMNHPLIGDKPLLLKGQVDTLHATSIRLSPKNAERLMTLAKQSFFNQPNVIIVLD